MPQQLFTSFDHARTLPAELGANSDPRMCVIAPGRAVRTTYVCHALSCTWLRCHDTLLPAAKSVQRAPIYGWDCQPVLGTPAHHPEASHQNTGQASTLDRTEPSISATSCKTTEVNLQRNFSIFGHPLRCSTLRPRRRPWAESLGSAAQCS
jgi:hypothetical protein